MKGLEVGVVMIVPAVVAIVLLVVVMRNVVVIAVETVEGVHGGSTCEDIRVNAEAERVVDASNLF